MSQPQSNAGRHNRTTSNEGELQQPKPDERNMDDELKKLFVDDDSAQTKVINKFVGSTTPFLDQMLSYLKPGDTGIGGMIDSWDEKEYGKMSDANVIINNKIQLLEIFNRRQERKQQHFKQTTLLSLADKPCASILGFKRVVTSAVRGNELDDRAIRFEKSFFLVHTPEDNKTPFCRTWQLSSDRFAVGVIAGPSGSGKTMLALDASKFHAPDNNETIIVYLNTDDLEDAGWTEKGPWESGPTAGSEDDDDDDVRKKARNESAEKVVVLAIERMIGHSFVYPPKQQLTDDDAQLPSDENNNDSNNNKNSNNVAKQLGYISPNEIRTQPETPAKVVIVIDEIDVSD